MYQHGAYNRQRVQFESHGVKIVGLLYTPHPATSQHPAIVILGPFGSIKEQSPMEYTTRLVRDGFVTLIIDYTTAEKPATLHEEAGLITEILAGRMPARIFSPVNNV